MVNKKENNQEGAGSVIYVNFKAWKVVSASANPSPEEVYALFTRHFGNEFSSWFVDQYKTLGA